MNCDELKHGGFCEVIKKHVPKSYCLEACPRYDKSIKYPSKLKMGVGFAKAAISHVVSGFKKRSKEEQQQCKDKCKAKIPTTGKYKCVYYVPKSKLGPRCKKCGCCITLAVMWATKNCPIGVW